MAYSENIKRLVHLLSQQGYSANDIETLLGKMSDKDMSSGFAEF